MTASHNLPLPCPFNLVRTMLAKILLAFFLVVSALAASDGPFLDKKHHTHEVLDNIHNTHHCAYPCIFDEKLIKEWTPECLKLEGKDYGACLCRANAYQYMLDQCIGWECDHKDGAVTGVRKKVISA
jgi:hypothetical protein